MNGMTDKNRDFVPALGKSGSLDRYDAAIALMTREKRWRGDSVMLAVDPDPAVLEIARAKADAAGADIRWFEAMGDELDAIDALQQCDKIVSSLVLHQCSMEVKQAIAAQMFRLLKPGGTLFIADYGEQRSLLMRMLFRQIQLLDGFEYTEPNAKGCVPEILADAGFQAVEEVRIIPTPTGSISIYRARR